MTNQLYNLATGNIDQAADHNQVIDAINTLLGYTNIVSINGATSGTATLYQILQGPIKMAVVAFTNFRNGPAGDQLLVLPAAFSNGCMGFNGDSGTFDLRSAGSQISVFVHTSFASSSADGSGTTTANIRQNNYWQGGAFDTIGLWGSDASTHHGFIVMIGS